MSELTKGQLRSGNNSSFPNNNTQAITPTILRDFNGDIIDSLVDEIGYNIDSGSWNSKIAEAGASGSLLTTASFSEGTRNMTFTKGDGTTFNVNIADSAALDTGSLLKDASNNDNATTTYERGNGATFTTTINNVNNSVSSSVSAVADSVPFSGVTNKPPFLVSGSSQISYPEIDNIPAGILSGSIASNLPSGVVSGSSQVDYPQITNIPSGLVSGSVIKEIVGGTDIGANTVSGVTTINNTMVTGSVARTNVNNNFSGDQTFNDIQVNGTGSFAYIQSVTGSAKIVGDAFIILNNDTPLQRFAGIKVQDSGSASPTTASFQFDGSTNDWFFEKEVGGTAEFGVSLFGPEYTSIGSPTYNASNKVLKGTGGHHLNDSNITDTGTQITLGSNTAVSGILTATQFSGMISGSSQVSFPGLSNIPAGLVSGSVVTELPSGTVSGSSQVNYPAISNIPAGIISGSAQVVLPAGTVSGSSQVDVTATTNYNQVVTKSGANTISGNNLLTGNNIFSGSNSFAEGITQNLLGTNNIPTINGDIVLADGGNGSTITVQGTASGGGRKTVMATTNISSTRNGTKIAFMSGNFDGYHTVYDSVSEQEFGFGLNGSTGLGTGWDGPSIVNNATSGYPYDSVIGFQKMGAYTDNRIAFLKPSHFYEKVIIDKSVVTAVTSLSPDASYQMLVDFSKSGVQTVTLAAGQTNNFIASNVEAGMTIVVKVIQNASTLGTVTFSNDFKQPDGSAYVASTTLGAIDVVTLMTFTNSEILVVSTRKFV